MQTRPKRLSLLTVFTWFSVSIFFLNKVIRQRRGAVFRLRWGSVFSSRWDLWWKSCFWYRSFSEFFRLNPVGVIPPELRNHLIIIIIILTEIGLSPGGSGYFTRIENMKLVTNKFKSSREGYMRSM